MTNNSGNITYTWYARDAQGNAMSTYKSAGAGGALTGYPVTLSEQHLYGSSRLGILNRNLDVKSTYTPGTIVTFQRGLKNYELSNHLGNVLVTISDKKSGISTNGTTIDNFIVDVRNATDYYPIEQILKKVENISSGLDEKHIQAAVNDLLGKPVIINGKIYDHLTEVNNNLKGLGNQI